MAFDITTAKPVEKTGFDISTAKPVEESPFSITEKPKSKLDAFTGKVTDYFFPQGLTDAKFEPGKRNIFGDVFERPGKAILSSIFPQKGESRLEAYKRGAVTPESQPSAKESLYLKSDIQPTGNKAIDFAKTFPAAFAGEVLDIGAQPANYIGGIIGKFLGKPAMQEVGAAKKFVKNTVDDITQSPFGQTFKSAFNKAKESASFPLKTGKTLKETFSNIKHPAEFAERTRKVFYKVKSDAVDKFGNRIDKLAQTNPDKTVSLRDTVDDIILNLNDMSPEARSALRKTPILNKLLKKPELADSISLKDTQEIINYINTKIPAQIKSKHLDILDTLNDVRASQLDAFPEMAGVRADYAKMIEPYKNLKNYFKFNKLLKAIESDFGGPEGIKAVKSILPEKVIKEMGGYKNAIKNLKLLKKTIPWVAAGVGGGVGFKIGKVLTNAGE